LRSRGNGIVELPLRVVTSRALWFQAFIRQPTHTHPSKLHTQLYLSIEFVRRNSPKIIIIIIIIPFRN